MTYPIFVMIWLTLDHYSPSPISLLRLGLIIGGILLLIFGIHTRLHLIGVLFMLIAAACYGLHLPINQRVLLEMPAPTVTFYTLLFMSLVVTPFSFFPKTPLWPPSASSMLPSLIPVFALGLVTFLSRLALFLGVKKIGGLQTALLGVIELLVTLLFSWLWLRETFNLLQWSGVLLISLSILLITFEKPPRRKSSRNSWLHWLQPHTTNNHQNPPPLD